MSEQSTDPPTDPRRLDSRTGTERPTTDRRCSCARYRRTTVAVSLAIGLVALWFLSSPATAQTDVGDVYCGTGVATGIDLVFGALAGLGLPVTGIYMGKAGFSYMNAGGDLEKQQTARQNLVGAGIGFGIVTLALVSPELIDKVGSQMGFGFSDCVTPF